MAEEVDLRHIVAIALHDAECSDHHCTPTVMGRFFAEADALLAAHDAQVKAEAWDEGYQACRTRPSIDGFRINRTNPYRAAETEATR